MRDRKQCPKCREELPLDSFAIDRRKKSGHKSICKPCDRAKSRRYYLEHREEKLAKAKAERVPRPIVECQTCGEPFEHSRKDRVFYSKWCKDRSRWAKWGP
jgi:formylmethanofuran dehydrogenase subunit E